VNLWNNLPIGKLVGTGTRVMLAANPQRVGTVRYARSGFVLVRWDLGGVSLEWGANVTELEQNQ
jgi:hypothetical protein